MTTAVKIGAIAVGAVVGGALACSKKVRGYITKTFKKKDVKDVSEAVKVEVKLTPEPEPIPEAVKAEVVKPSRFKSFKSAFSGVFQKKNPEVVVA